MTSSQCHRVGLGCRFVGEDIPSLELWDKILPLIANFGMSRKHYAINPGLGSRKKFRDSQVLLPLDEIRREIALDDSNSFLLYENSSFSPFASYTPTPLDGGLQRLSIVVTIPNGMYLDWSQIASCLAQYDQMIFAYPFNQYYNGWQNCNDPGTYARLYGEIGGFSTYECGHFPHIATWLDTSRNPGRETVNGLLPQRVEAELWLGSSFWQLAPCEKEEVLAADYFLDVRDTPEFLYLKSWPHPFTRPDGEQGRVQQKLWRLLFHDDCEWPPGSGGISDFPVGGPPELMPSGE